MKSFFHAPWSSRLRLTTMLFVALMLLIALLAPFGSGVLIGLVALFTSTMFFIRGYSIGDGHITIYGLIWRKRLDLDRLTNVRVAPFIMAGSWRTLGSSGVFSRLGYFQSRELGRFMAFVTDSENSVLLEFDHGKIVISPENPVDFATQVEDEYGRINRRKTRPG